MKVAVLVVVVTVFLGFLKQDDAEQGCSCGSCKDKSPSSNQDSGSEGAVLGLWKAIFSPGQKTVVTVLKFSAAVVLIVGQFAIELLKATK
jgi:hypothetical protein